MKPVSWDERFAMRRQCKEKIVIKGAELVDTTWIPSPIRNESGFTGKYWNAIYGAFSDNPEQYYCLRIPDQRTEYTIAQWKDLTN